MSEVKLCIYFAPNVSNVNYRRILCLTDGEDNKSRATALEAVNLLRVMRFLYYKYFIKYFTL